MPTDERERLPTLRYRGIKSSGFRQQRGKGKRLTPNRSTATPNFGFLCSRARAYWRRFSQRDAAARGY